jgi:DNA processing protein
MTAGGTTPAAGAPPAGDAAPADTAHGGEDRISRAAPAVSAGGADELFAWAELADVPGIGPVRFLRLLARFRSAAGALAAGRAALLAAGLDAAACDALERARAEAGGPGRRAGKIAAAAAACGARVVRLCDPGYPAALRGIHDPPPVLYVRGALPAGPAVAVVGTRAATPYGRRVAHEVAAGLARAGVTVVSGLAAGIDAAAHEGALAAGGPTVAVLGCGVDVDYPRRNAALAAAVRERGAVMSEFAPGTAPCSGNFPARNRIISGLAQGVVVVEAGLKSGALITAGCALEQGREVMAVPGPVCSHKSAGTHALIRDGAALVATARDVLEVVGLAAGGAAPADCGAPAGHGARECARAAFLAAGPNGPRVLGFLSAAGTSVEDVVAQAGLDAGGVAGCLVQLELAGLAVRLPGGAYARLGTRECGRGVPPDRT